ELAVVRERVQGINGLAKVHVTQQSRVPQLEGVLLDLHAYDDVDAGALEFASKGHSHLDPIAARDFWLMLHQTISTLTLSVPTLPTTPLLRLDAWLRSVLWERTLPRSSSNSAPAARSSANSVGLTTASAISTTSSTPASVLSSTQQAAASPTPLTQGTAVGFEIHRLKGRILLSDGGAKMLQGVREVFEMLDAKDGSGVSKARGSSSAENGGKIVLIGRGLLSRENEFEHNLREYLEM
ncbi:MAG: hypothetical protein Q9157_006713, partial [Trypethelium eluteriae]